MNRDSSAPPRVRYVDEVYGYTQGDGTGTRWVKWSITTKYEFHKFDYSKKNFEFTIRKHCQRLVTNFSHVHVFTSYLECSPFDVKLRLGSDYGNLETKACIVWGHLWNDNFWDIFDTYTSFFFANQCRLAESLIIPRFVVMTLCLFTMLALEEVFQTFQTYKTPNWKHKHSQIN